MEEKKEKEIKIEDAATTEAAENGENTATDKSAEEAREAEQTSEEAHEGEQAQEETPEEVTPEEMNAKLKDQLLRTMAEFDNYKKRTIKEKTELILNGGQRAVTAILPVIDDMERAMADKSDDPEAIRQGVEMIYHKFLKALEGLGVKKIETEGQDFDVDFHEAIALVPGMGDDKKGKVIDCTQTGYTMNDKVIRHAKVAVGQ